MNDVKYFIKERVPLPANIILALGLILSVQSLFAQSIPLSSILSMALTLVLFITELRFMDELKDYEKDKVANPTRPLPSGKISTQMVSSLVNGTFLLLIGTTIYSYFQANSLAAALLGSSLIWLFLMYKEFFIPKLINKSPFFYAVTHQIVIVPIVLFVIATLNPELVWTTKSLGYCMIILGSFFTYEVGRKMDPMTHPILKTYLFYYKKNITHLMIASLLLFTLAGAVLIDKTWWFVPSIALIILTQIKLFITNTKHKDLEGLIALNLIFNIWVIFIQGFFT